MEGDFHIAIAGDGQFAADGHAEMSSISIRFGELVV